MVITAALTGAVPMPDRFPTVPVTPASIVADAIKCAVAGATVVHLHVRAEDATPIHRRDLYESVYAGIRAQRPELIQCTTTSSRVGGGLATRLTGLEVEAELRPEMATLTLGSFNFPTTTSVNPPQEIMALAERMAELDVRPEFEIFDLGMVDVLGLLSDRGLLPAHPVVNLFVGNPGSLGPYLEDVAAAINRLPDGCEWALAGIGKYQRSVIALAALLGGNARTGLEDNPRGDHDGWGNADAVAQVVEAATFARRAVASACETRERFGVRTAP
ncbi:MAG: 3-keto-5-aminohexanoate cleavage protein [Acidimicrobiia bacterium]